MKTTMKINVRNFPVTIQDTRTGKVSQDNITLTKQHLQAAQLVGESSKELITRIFNRNGYEVLNIEKPMKEEIEINLEELYWSEGED